MVKGDKIIALNTYIKIKSKSILCILQLWMLHFQTLHGNKLDNLGDMEKLIESHRLAT